MSQDVDAPIAEATTGRVARLAWPDVARGTCVILVVALHVYSMAYEDVFGATRSAAVWDILVSAALPIRMPLFFLISGYLASRALTRSWKSVSRNRIWQIVYLYYIWLAIFVVFRIILIENDPMIVNRSIPWGRYVLEIFWPDSSLWYLYALVLYFVLARLFKNAWLLPTIAMAGLISVASLTFLADSPLQYILRCFVFYVIGIRAPEVVELVVSWSRWRRLVGLTILYALISGVAFVVGRETLGVLSIAAVVGVAAGLQASYLMGEWKIAGPLRSIGRQTLPIFVLHPILIELLMLVLHINNSAVERMSGNEFVSAAAPIVTTAAVIGMSLIIESTLKRARLGFLFKLPRIGRAADTSELVGAGGK